MSGAVVFPKVQEAGLQSFGEKVTEKHKAQVSVELSEMQWNQKP